MECININTPEFKKLAEELGNPLLAEIAMNKSPLPSKIKEGVDYTFEQNPELANAVYEALGFKSEDYTGIGTEDLDNLIDDNLNVNWTLLDKLQEELFSKEAKWTLKNRPEKHSGEKFTWEHIQNVVESAKKIPIPNNVDRKTLILAALLHDIGKPYRNEDHALDSVKVINRLFKDNKYSKLVKLAVRYHMISTSTTQEEYRKIIQDAKINGVKPEDFIELLLSLNIADITRNRAEDTIDDYSGKSIKDTIFEEIPFKRKQLETISQQQKQQAQQLYSQYLDTIFPDSKVKDIVYRGSERGIEKEENPWLYFSDSSKDAYMYAKAHISKSGNITERNPIHVIKDNIAKIYNLSKNILWAVTDTQLGVNELEYEGYITKEEASEAKRLLNTNQDIKNLKELIELYPSVKIESEGDLMKQFDDEDFIKNKPKYDRLRKELEPFFDRTQVGKLEAVMLNITNPLDGGNQEDLINNREAYQNGHDGAIVLGGEHFIVRRNSQQIHILGSKQDIEGFKEWAKKERIEFSQRIENEMDEEYWRKIYTDKKLSNREDFESVNIPTIKNKFKPDAYNVYHGTNTYEIDNDGNLILTPSRNFEDRTYSISFTQVPVVAQDYMLRKNGNIIIKIKNEALKNKYEIESIEEIAVNGNVPLVIPKDQYDIIKVSSLSERMKAKYSAEVQERLENLKTLSDIEALDSAFSDMVIAENYSELQEYNRGGEDDTIPRWYVADEYLDSRAGKTLLSELKSKIDEKFIIDGFSQIILKGIEQTGVVPMIDSNYLYNYSTYGSRHTPHGGDLFSFLLEYGKIENRSEEIIKEIKNRIDIESQAAIDLYNSPEKIKEREENQKLNEERIRKYNELHGKELEKDIDWLPFQKKGITVTSSASPKTIALIKGFIKKIGVDIESLKNIVVNGEKKDANGVALLMQQLIQVVEGKEASALPEEAMHFVVAIIKQKNPKLYKKLLGEINNYRILNDVFAEYGNDYVTADGKPDIIRLKEEAIAKVLAEYIIKKTEGTIEKPENIQKVHSLWRDIIDFFKNLFSTSGFDKLSMDIITGRFEGTAEDIKEGGEFYSKRKSQNDIYNDIKSKSDTIGKDDNGYFINGRRIKFRVHDIINNWYQKLFEEKKLLETDFEKAVNEIYREKGDAGHKDIEYAFHVLVDENGYIRETPLNDDNYISQISPTDRDLYNTLKENLEKRLSSYEEGTRFMAEVKVYDPRRDLAGTIDFIAITPEGEVNIIDWKFMNLNVEKYTDVPWYKVGAWQNQLVQYKLILQKAYGINSENFRQTRTIPIQAKYTKTDYKSGIKPVLISIKIGDIDIKNITEDFLLPVGIESERTRIKKIDTLIDKLNIIYKILSQKKVTPEDKQNKADQLNHLYRAIRHLQIKQDVAPLINQVKILSSQIDKIISTYNKKFLGKDPKTFNEEEINTFAKDVEDSIDIIGAYTRIDNELGFLFRGETQTKEDEDMLKELRDVANKAREYELELQDILNDFTADIIAKGVDVDKLLSPEKIVKGITRWLVSTSGIQLRSMHVLYRKVNKAFSYAAFDTEKEIRTLNKLKDDYLKWADSKGLSKKQYFNIIKKKDSNELIDQYDINFYRVLKKKKQERDFAWIRDNIDVDGYKLFLEDRLNKEIERIRNKPRSFTDSELADIKEGKEPFVITQEIEDAKRLYDISKNDSLGWLLYEEIKGYPKKELWYSKEWRELIKPENAPAKAFYDYISKKNKEYRDLGYISNARTFLPYVRKNLVEKLVTGGNIRLGEQFFRSISIDEGDIGYGKIDPLTGRPVDAIPKYFTSKIEDEVSEDLFHTMSLYNEAALRYKYLTQIEDQVRALVRVERNKKAIATSTFGKTIREGGDIKYIDDNNENTKLVEDMMKAIVYGQKFLESETFDQLLFKLGTWGKKFNEKLGIKVFPEDLQDRQISMNKSINQLNNYFQLNALGLNVLSASSNFLGGNFQSIINAGKYFTKTDYVKAEQLLFVNKFNGTNKKKMAAFLHYFLPLTENYNTLLTKNLSLHKFSQENMQDFLMILMRQSDANIQLSNFYAYLFNTIVIDGKIVNAREYVRALPEYENKYGGTTEQLREYNERFDEKVKELVDKYGILTVAKVENDELVIPGIARNSDTVVELRRKVQQLSKDALGNLTEDDLRWLNLVIYGKSLLMFKNWIPRLVDVRFGNIKYNSASDAYEWGRVRTVVRIISKDLLHSIGNLRGVLIGNERGVALMRELYEQKREEYEYNTDKELDMTETEFMDLVRANVKNQIVDIIFLSILSMMLFGLKAIAPDDDDDEAIRNQYRFAVRMLDKFTSELSYFYDPTSLTGLVSSSLFPSLSLINNFEKAFKNFIKENYAIVIGDEKMEEDTKVLKYIMKSFPFASQMAGYLPMFYPELAKDLGLRIQSNYSLVRR